VELMSCGQIESRAAVANDTWSLGRSVKAPAGPYSHPCATWGETLRSVDLERLEQGGPVCPGTACAAGADWAGTFALAGTTDVSDIYIDILIENNYWLRFAQRIRGGTYYPPQ